MTTLIPLALFGFVERVARLREAQRRFDDVQSQYNRNQMVPLMLEVDALGIVILRSKVSDEFKAFADIVGEMRKAQHELLKVRSQVADARCIQLESAVDQALCKYAQQVKDLNALLDAENFPERSVMTNNRKMGGGRR